MGQRECRTEADLKRTIEELEGELAERTAELTAANARFEHEVERCKRIEEDLRQEQSSLRLLLDQIPSAVVWRTDDKLRYTWISGPPLDKMRLTPRHVVGKTAAEYFETDDPEYQPVKAHRQALAGTPSGYERQVGDIVISVHLEPLRDGQGKIIGVIGTGFDITERRRIEQELRDLSRRLVNAQEEERRSIARELHDQISQSLALLKLLLDKAMSNPAGRLNFSFSEAQELVIELIDQVRNLSLNLRPKMLDDLGLLPTLLWHFERYTAKTGIDVEFKHTGLNTELPAEVSTAAYRIVQEALSNVARHASTGKVAVRVFTDSHYLHIEVSDSGVGFDPAKLEGRVSSGISGMRERVLLLGGSFALKTAPGKGTHINVRLPLGGPAA